MQLRRSNRAAGMMPLSFVNLIIVILKAENNQKLQLSTASSFFTFKDWKKSFIKKLFNFILSLDLDLLTLKKHSEAKRQVMND